MGSQASIVTEQGVRHNQGCVKAHVYDANQSLGATLNFQATRKIQRL